MIRCSALETYLKQKFKLTAQILETCITTPSEKNIHDLRVSLRRLIAVVEFILFLYDNEPKRKKTIQKVRKQLKYFLRSMSTLRDLQVQILHIESQENRPDSLTQYLHHLQLEEQKKHAKLPVKFKKWSLKELKKDAVRALHNNPVKDREIEMKTYLYLHYLTDRMHARIDQSNSQPASYHKVRIALKKYRYYLEFLENAFYLKQGLLPYLKKWQDRLGHFQDHVVFLDSLDPAKIQNAYDHQVIFKLYMSEINDILPALKQDLYELKFKTRY